jgi:hypothetical protein
VTLLTAAAMLIGAASSSAQTDIAPVPVVTGYGAFTATFEPGTQSMNPTLAPILLVPLGKRALLETEFEVEADMDRTNGMWGDRTVDKGIEYVQVDYVAHPLMTIVGGRFLTPFGIYNERLHPAWIRNLMTAPLIFGLSANSSMGGMVRGGVPIGSGAVLNYAAYYSVPYSSEHPTLKLLNSDRSTGGRWSLFATDQRFETGFSFKRSLGDDRFNAYGGDLTWNVTTMPLDIRAEFARSAHGNGYWLEGAYRTVDVPFWSGFFRRSQFVARVEKFYAPAVGQTMADMMVDGQPPDVMASADGAHGALPDTDLTRPMVGWNYYFHDGFKFSLGYGRSMTLDDAHKVWSVGMAYRFGS